MAKSLATVTEAPLFSEHQELISKVIADALTFLNLPIRATPRRIVNEIDQYVRKLQMGVSVAPKTERTDIFFGCLWGAQLVRELSWDWASVSIRAAEDTKMIGVFSKDRALAIYPFQFISDCLSHSRTVTIKLSFEMLRNGDRIPPLPCFGYANVMDHVRRIIPGD